MCAWFSLPLASPFKGLQRPKNERKCLRLWSSSNKAKCHRPCLVASVHTWLLCSARRLSQCVLCAIDARHAIVCKWYHASVFADARVSVQDARRMLCQCYTVNQALVSFVIQPKVCTQAQGHCSERARFRMKTRPHGWPLRETSFTNSPAL